MLIKIRYPIYVSVLISFVFCPCVVDELEAYSSSSFAFRLLVTQLASNCYSGQFVQVNVDIQPILLTFMLCSSRNFMNDALRTNVFVRYQPGTIACACIYLSARQLKVMMATVRQLSFILLH